MAGPGLSQEFLFFFGYHRRFIPNFADLATPLVALTVKDVPFVWGSVCSKPFYSLRDSLIQAPILAFPMETVQYILDSDASNFGLGGVLSQLQNDVERVVLDLHRDVIAQRNVKCWPLCLWAYSCVPTYMAPNSPFKLTTNHKCGCTDSRIPKV